MQPDDRNGEEGEEMKSFILDILIAFLMALALSITFNPSPLYLLGILNPEDAARIVVEGK